jgi:protein-S-isoprenylcysteine O-methyltransferase Ste14
VSVAIRACIYVVLGLAVLVGWVPALIDDLVPGPLFLLGLPILCVGLAIYLWTIWVFATVGGGTPVPLDPPRKLVVRGLYQIIRNPMAFGLLSTLIGEAVAFGSPPIFLYAAVLFPVLHLFIVLVEEPGLRRRFGASYEAYCQSVPRWLPRLRRPSRRGS